jgi:peptide/nickel transport system ATP-binding protein/oligopeptide transport system ATP-binding protein
VTALLQARGVSCHFVAHRGLLQRPGRAIRAVDEVDLDLDAGECLALVGESGAGKTTLGRCLLRLTEPTAGSIRFAGEDLLTLGPTALRRRRRQFQMIFQDPFGSLDPRQRIGSAIAEPLAIHEVVSASRRPERVSELLRLVGLAGDNVERYPHEFSGGQRQRIGIARALACEPRLVVADEPVSSLDVSIRMQIVDLLLDLRRRLGLALLFIAHDLVLVERIADRVAVMYRGRVVETGPVRELFSAPKHPYTAALLSAVPVPQVGGRRDRVRLGAEPKGQLTRQLGCALHLRCPSARDICAEDRPRLLSADSGHAVACHYPGELAGASSCWARDMEQSTRESVVQDEELEAPRSVSDMVES